MITDMKLLRIWLRRYFKFPILDNLKTLHFHFEMKAHGGAMYIIMNVGFI